MINKISKLERKDSLNISRVKNRGVRDELNKKAAAVCQLLFYVLTANQSTAHALTTPSSD